MPAGIEDRDADVWEALLAVAVADAAGGHWPADARSAARALVDESKQSTPSLGVRLLTDLHDAFTINRDNDGHPVEYADHLSTDEILSALHAQEEAPWGDLRGKPLDQRGLANRLRPYGVRSKQVRIDKDTTLKGYRRQDLWDAWTRYLPAVGPAPHRSETSETSETDPCDVSLGSDVSDPMGGVPTDAKCRRCHGPLWAPESRHRGMCEACARAA